MRQIWGKAHNFIRFVEIPEREYGKPYLKGYKNFHFNIAHTRNAIVVSISNDPIGIDIEKIKKANRQIAKRFFTPVEQRYINKLANKVDGRFYHMFQ